MAAIARREALRRSGVRREIVTGETAELHEREAEDPLDTALLRLDVERLLRTLTIDERRLLTLRYHLDLSQRAVALALDVPEGTVKVRLHRLRKLLQERLCERDLEN